MILIAESGSTKTTWTDLEGSIEFETRGLNPFFVSSEDVVRYLSEEIPAHVVQDSIEHIHFYGAGCSNDERCETIRMGLSQVFSRAAVNVEHDLLAAARALCQKDSGIACILGTGSNSCRFDGEQITHNVPALGYVLGDEGSAGWLGQRLVAAYFYDELPQDIADSMATQFDMDKEVVLHTTYQKPLPNTYLGGFAKVLDLHRENEFAQTLIRTGFLTFIEHHIRKYAPSPTEPIHFVGSVAFAYNPLLRSALEDNGLTMGQVKHDIRADLIEYHRN
jgi:N-acetylglucosamine kinase-like BadF-type ATPase